MKVKKMEQWKQSTLTGAALIILAAIFAAIRKEMNIWIILIILLGVVDIIFGLYRKKGRISSDSSQIDGRREGKHHPRKHTH